MVKASLNFAPQNLWVGLRWKWQYNVLDVSCCVLPAIEFNLLLSPPSELSWYVALKPSTQDKGLLELICWFCGGNQYRKDFLWVEFPSKAAAEHFCWLATAYGFEVDTLTDMPF